MRMAMTRFLRTINFRRQHDVSLNDTFFRLLVLGGGVATSHQNVCHLDWVFCGLSNRAFVSILLRFSHLFHKVHHEEATENPDFSEWPTLEFHFEDFQKGL